MGKLFTGYYGQSPTAESAMSISLRECHQKLGLKPTDFVSFEEPDFFQKKHGAKGKYLVFAVDAAEIDNVMWRPGYYLLPLEAEEVLKAFQKGLKMSSEAIKKPVERVCKAEPPEDVAQRAHAWADSSQPLFFECRCPHLILKLDAPFGLRRRWKARLVCAKRCQPALTTLL